MDPPRLHSWISDSSLSKVSEGRFGLQSYQTPSNTKGSLGVLFPVEISGKIENQKDEQNEAKATTSDHWASKVKSSATKQEHQNY